jgi:outer membrane protein OmpA-like peptidoglycan-associated protein
MRRLLLVLLILTTLSAFATDLDGSTHSVRFTTCPVYRDTDAGRKSGCWIADDGITGQRYDVSDAPFKPWLGRMILVEGQVAATADICGGVPLRPVRVAVLETRCPEVMIPAEGYPSKPSSLPKETMPPLSVPRISPLPPYSRQQYEVEFTFGDDRLMYQHVELTIEKAMLYAVASNAKVTLTAYADTEGFNASDHHLYEPDKLAQDRGAVVREALVRLGIAPARITLTTSGHPVALTGWPDALALSSKRRVTIVVTPQKNRR